jgi:arsenite methyltransferase
MSRSHSVAELTSAELRQAVANRYGQVAARPTDGFNFPVGRAFAEAVGYPPATLDAVPAAASASFAGVTYLPAWSNVRPGERVVDLGCGAGLDTLIAAQAVGADGHVDAIDVSAEMVALARANVGTAGQTNVAVHRAAVVALPLPDGFVDVVVANGVFNLEPVKEQAVAEVARVLKPGGRLVGAEIVLTEAVPHAERGTLDDWFR